MENETKEKKKILHVLKNKVRQEEIEFDGLDITDDLRNSTKVALQRELTQHRQVIANKI